MDKAREHITGKWSVILFWLALAVVLAGCPAPSTDSRSISVHPPRGMHTPQQLTTITENLNREPWSAAYAVFVQDLERAMLLEPKPTAHFEVPPYYTDPEGQMSAKAALSSDAYAAYALALSWQIGPEEHRLAHAMKAVSILDAWASQNECTRGTEAELVICYVGVPLVMAADLIADCPDWGDAERSRFYRWLDSVFLPAAKSISVRPNNWGDWGLLGIVAANSVQDNVKGVEKSASILRQRLEFNIRPDGELGNENMRTNSGMHYTAFALLPMTASAQIIRNVTGEDLFEYTNSHGVGLRDALEKHFQYCLNPDSWPYRLPTGLAGALLRALWPCADTLLIPEPSGESGHLLDAMSAEYDLKEWEEWAATGRPLHLGRAWLYPTLVRQR